MKTHLCLYYVLIFTKEEINMFFEKDTDSVGVP
jgi:hypothetical protein